MTQRSQRSRRARRSQSPESGRVVNPNPPTRVPVASLHPLRPSVSSYFSVTSVSSRFSVPSVPSVPSGCPRPVYRWTSPRFRLPLFCAARVDDSDRNETADVTDWRWRRCRTSPRTRRRAKTPAAESRRSAGSIRGLCAFLSGMK
jgi:hypothetical protein